MPAPARTADPADISLLDLERATRSPLTWQIFPWGLSGASGQRWVRDQLVIVNPALPAEQRHRQLTVVRSWIPTAEGVTRLAIFGLPLFLAITLHSLWLLLGWILPVLWLSDPFGRRTLTRWLEGAFDRHAPRTERVVLGGASRYGQINEDGARLHQVLLNLAFEHRRWIDQTDPAQEQQVHQQLWTALQDHPIPDLVSLAAYLDPLAINPVLPARATSSECPSPATCCRHRSAAGECS